MNITLDQILKLVGRLDDSPAQDSPRERFRQFLIENAPDVGQVRDYIEECLRSTGEQYNRALQDLVNHLGHFLGFDVTYGRYQGVSNQTGYDGYWKSSSRDFHVVVEVKTTEVYAIKLHTLANYIDRLISEEKLIPSWEKALGLYVVGRPDPELRQLENAILAEKRMHQFRIISVNSLLSLAEMMSQYDISHDDILALIRPSGPKIDSIVDLMARLVAEPTAEESIKEIVPDKLPAPILDESAYWLTPVKSDEEQTADDVIRMLVGQEKVYAFGERTPGRRDIKPGDWICFYATGTGVVAHAKVTSEPKKRPHKKVRHPEKYPWTFRLDEANLYLDEPVVIDAELRAKLDAFAGRDPNTSYWAWLVQATRRLTQHDFCILTQQHTEVS